MTFRNFAIVTALSSATALAAHATENDTTNIYDDDGDRQQTQETMSESMGEATVDAEGQVTAPFSGDVSKPELTEADRTKVENIVAAADEGAIVTSVDDLEIGTIYANEGDLDAEHLVYVNVAEDANLMADRIAFRTSTLSVEESGGLEYALTLEQLREAVADKVSDSM
ncbi:phosphoribosylglycinamide synthetase [Roseovarius sp. MMSF_3281]|uniref:phosphoribosylglycinamide synthetase n=1 Tax=Roseovarius sp. MMSF_3281 TaxID=3046694 RepID=UPI00273E26D2|nr:phosphoribosylglycinamide synthetase [Roseovarius sp. MMSF_3281]